MSDRLFELVWMQRLGGGCEVLRRGIPAQDALAVLRQAEREDYGPGGVTFLRPDGETGATAELSARLAAAEADAAELRRLAIALRNIGMRLAAPGSEQWRDILQDGKRAEAALYAAAERPPARSTTPEQAGEQAERAMAIAAELDQLFGKELPHATDE
jgi:hypothetical protein